MTSITDLQALLERVEACKGPDRNLDDAIYDALCAHATQEWTEWDSRHDFTNSIDTAIALMDEKLPGWIVTVTIGADRNEVTLHEFDPPCRRIPEERPHVITGKTAPVALLSALLRALIAQQEKAHA